MISFSNSSSSTGNASPVGGDDFFFAVPSLPAIAITNDDDAAAAAAAAVTQKEETTTTRELQPPPHGFKRHRDDSTGTCPPWPPKKRVKAAAASAITATSPAVASDGSPSAKNSLMLLHELKPSVEYKLVSQTGPSHRPIFTIAVEINGTIFEGMAQTKKEAKQAAAEKALRSFVDLPFPLVDESAAASGNDVHYPSLSETPPSLTLSTSELHASSSSASLEQVEEQERASPSLLVNEPREIQSGMSPLYILNQLRRDATFELITSGDSNSSSSSFTYEVTVDGQKFIGSGRNKKMAKTRAAQLALEKLFGMSFDASSSSSVENDTLPSNLPYSRRDLADRIAACIQTKFTALTANDVRLQRRKVLAGIVMTRNWDLDSMQVICVTTGTKCIGGDRLTMDGRALNDCHAEIIARRCLHRYCYQQLDQENLRRTDSIFEEIAGDSRRFKLKENVHFHLYISTSPCGDGRLFAPQEQQQSPTPSTSESAMSDTNGDKVISHPLRKSRGLLRTKIEAGEGTIPVLAKTMYQCIQTWDGVLGGGERLLTMSCSDKLCRWNFIGLQGGLLSSLIEPIYYTSIIIGSLYHSEHIRRALFGRIEHAAESIPGPYGLRRPFISGVSSPEMRTTSRAPSHAFIWNCVEQTIEVIETLTGLTASQASSSISKAVLFERWLCLKKPVTMTNNDESESLLSPPNIYCDAKLLAKDYQTAKMQVNRAFQKNGFGLWIVRPHEQDEFDLCFSSSPSTVDVRQAT